MTTQTKMSDFITRNQITIRCELVDQNPNFSDDVAMNHYKVRLRTRRFRRQMTLFYSMGIGHHRAPTVQDVLDCLASDSATVHTAADFDDWCRELGFDPDSRRAERTFHACEYQARKLKQFLGDDEFNKLLWHTERD